MKLIPGDLADEVYDDDLEEAVEKLDISAPNETSVSRPPTTTETVS
jgi:hypothetical protein